MVGLNWRTPAARVVVIVGDHGRDRADHGPAIAIAAGSQMDLALVDES